MKWNYMSICFVCEWCIGFFSKTKLLWLLENVKVGFSCLYPMFRRNILSQRTYLVAWVQAIYSTLVEEIHTIACFLLAQETSIPLRKNTWPFINLLVSMLCPQSESQKPCSFMLMFFSRKFGEYRNARFWILCKYINSCLTICQCDSPRLLKNWAMISTTACMSGLVLTMQYMMLLTTLLYGTLTISRSFFCWT
jgi:hypothetical protein